MKEKTARNVMSGWSAFRLGMTRPELTVLGVGEWDRPGGDGWGVIIRDLRTGVERVVFDEAEWKRIKRDGLPPVGQPFGEPLLVRPDLPAGVEGLIKAEGTLSQLPTQKAPIKPQIKADQAASETDEYWEMEEFIINLDHSLGGAGSDMAADLDKPPPGARRLTRKQIDALATSVRRGTPRAVRAAWDGRSSEAAANAVIEWVWRQQIHEQPVLGAVLAGSQNLDLSRGVVTVAPDVTT